MPREKSWSLPQLLGSAGKRHSDRWLDAQTTTCSWISSHCFPQLTLALTAFSWPTAAAPYGCERDGCRLLAGGGGEQQLRTPSLPPTAHSPLLYWPLIPLEGDLIWASIKIPQFSRKSLGCSTDELQEERARQAVALPATSKNKEYAVDPSPLAEAMAVQDSGVAREGGQSVVGWGTYAMDTQSRLQSPEPPIWH